MEIESLLTDNYLYLQSRQPYYEKNPTLDIKSLNLAPNIEEAFRNDYVHFIGDMSKLMINDVLEIIGSKTIAMNSQIYKIQDKLIRFGFSIQPNPVPKNQLSK